MPSPKRPVKRLSTSGVCASKAKRIKEHPNSQSTRPRRACDQCRQRRAKCDKKKPCGRCFALKRACSLDDGTPAQPFFHVLTKDSMQEALNSSTSEGSSKPSNAVTASQVNDEAARQKSDLAAKSIGLEARARRSTPGKVQPRLKVVFGEDQNNEFAGKQEASLATCEALKRQKTELLEKCDTFTFELEALRSQHETLLAGLEGLKGQKDEVAQTHLELLQSKIKKLEGEHEVENLERRNSEPLHNNNLLREMRAQKRQQETPRHLAVKGTMWPDSASTKYMPTRQPMETAPFNPYLTGGQSLMENTTALPAYLRFPPLSNHSVEPQDWPHREGAANDFYQWRMT